MLAGSLSPVTARQVRAAVSYDHVTVTPAQLLDAAATISHALREGRNVLACTAPPDPATADTHHTAEVAAASARFLRHLLRTQARLARPLRRIGIAGGDTSSLAVQGLGFWGLSYAGALGPGVTLSRGHSDDRAPDGLELMLKGGQMGAEDVFERLLRPGAGS